MYNNILKKTRKEKKISQKTISQMLDIKENTYSGYETEYQIIPIKYLNQICNYLNISFDYVFEFTQEIKYKNSKMNIDTNLMAKHLKEFRKEHKLTQLILTKELNISRTTLANYECGTYPIATTFLYAICKKYKISADYLLGKIDEPKSLK